MSDFDLDSRREREEEKPPIEVPMEALKPELLRAVIESFVLREGTDYGRNEVELNTKVEQVEKQIAKGLVKIVFDSTTESINLLTAHEAKKWLK